MYYDRTEAGSILAKALKKYRQKPGLVLAVPRGGVPIACIVASELGFPLDLLLTKKIGYPGNSEYAIGAVSLSDRYVVPHEGVSQAYIEKETLRIRETLTQMYTKFVGNKAPESLKDRTVIVVDDGIATGNTLLSTINMLRSGEPAKIVIAVPVASASAIQKLQPLADDIVCPLIPPFFRGVGAFYKHFGQVSDEEVLMYLKRFNDNSKMK